MITCAHSQRRAPPQVSSSRTEPSCSALSHQLAGGITSTQNWSHQPERTTYQLWSAQLTSTSLVPAFFPSTCPTESLRMVE